jgi:hypothetical protein
MYNYFISSKIVSPGITGSGFYKSESLYIVASASSIIFFMLALYYSSDKYDGFYTGTVNVMQSSLSIPKFTAYFIFDYTCYGVSCSLIFYRSARLVIRLSLTDISLDNGPQ